MSNPLTDVLPPKVRRIAYAVVFVAGLVFAAYQAADGDWAQLAGAVLVSLTSLLAASNTDVP